MMDLWKWVIIALLLGGLLFGALHTTPHKSQTSVPQGATATASISDVDLDCTDLTPAELPVEVLGQLTSYGATVDGSVFQLSCDAATVNTLTFSSPKTANGAEIAYIRPGNGIVVFSIERGQLKTGTFYVLPQLAKDPPGDAGIIFRRQ